MTSSTGLRRPLGLQGIVARPVHGHGARSLGGHDGIGHHAAGGAGGYPRLRDGRRRRRTSRRGTHLRHLRRSRGAWPHPDGGGLRGREVDPRHPKTLEFLETQRVPVIGVWHGRVSGGVLRPGPVVCCSRVRRRYPGRGRRALAGWRGIGVVGAASCCVSPVPEVPCRATWSRIAVAQALREAAQGCASARADAVSAVRAGARGRRPVTSHQHRPAQQCRPRR